MQIGRGGWPVTIRGDYLSIWPARVCRTRRVADQCCALKRIMPVSNSLNEPPSGPPAARQAPISPPGLTCQAPPGARLRLSAPGGRPPAGDPRIDQGEIDARPAFIAHLTALEPRSEPARGQSLAY